MVSQYCFKPERCASLQSKGAACRDQRLPYGRGSGIGRALALELAARGADLALADRDEAGLQSVAAEIGKAKRRKVTHAPRRCRRVPPISRPSRTRRSRRIPSLNIVINNAGVALLGEFSEIDQSQMEWLMNINFWGVVH